MRVRVGESQDEGLEHLSDLGALDDRPNVVDSLDSCIMHLLVGVVENVTEALHDLG